MSRQAGRCLHMHRTHAPHLAFVSKLMMSRQVGRCLHMHQTHAPFLLLSVNWWCQDKLGAACICIKLAPHLAFVSKLMMTSQVGPKWRPTLLIISEQELLDYSGHVNRVAFGSGSLEQGKPCRLPYKRYTWCRVRFLLKTTDPVTSRNVTLGWIARVVKILVLNTL
jgi:hypothetical protein